MSLNQYYQFNYGDGPRRDQRGKKEKNLNKKSTQELIDKRVKELDFL